MVKAVLGNIAGRICSVIIMLGILAALIPALPGPALAATQPYTMKTVTIEGAEGANLPAHLYIPTGEAPEGGFPAIVFIHSWVLNQWEYDIQMQKFARAGYVAICYTCRGWYSAGGEIGTAGPLEMQDLNKVVDWLIANAPVNPEKLGATGISYGGGQSLLALKFEPRFKTVVSMSGWTDLCESLAPEDSPKWLWSGLLVGTAALFGDQSKEMTDWLLSYLTNNNVDDTKRDLMLRSPVSYLNDVNGNNPPPVFIINAINDDLFTSRQIVNFYQRYQGPKKLMLANGIHATAEATGLLGLPNSAWGQTLDWFNYWLKGDENGIMNSPAVSVYQKWTNSQGTFADWPIPETVNKVLYLAGSEKNRVLQENEPGKDNSVQLLNTVFTTSSSGIPMVSPLLYSYLNTPVNGASPSLIDQSKGSVMFESGRLDKNMTVIGTPRINVSVKPDKDQFQVNFMIYDVDKYGKSVLVAHSPYTLKNAGPGNVTRVNLQMNVLSHQFKAGHKIRLVVCTSDAAYVLPVPKPFRLDLLYGGNTSSSIELPVLP
ncbi:MAG: CocE/NonD family hydrolase [Bacillota bacterium]